MQLESRGKENNVMMNFEDRQERRNPISDDVFIQFVVACQRLMRFGEHAQAGEAGFYELIVHDGLVLPNPVSLEDSPTHVGSGPIDGRSVSGLIKETINVWVPIEGITNHPVPIGEQEAALCTVIKSTFEGSRRYPAGEYINTQDFATTADGRVFELFRDIPLNGHFRENYRINEHTDNAKIIAFTSFLSIVEDDLRRMYPDV